MKRLFSILLILFTCTLFAQNEELPEVFREQLKEAEQKGETRFYEEFIKMLLMLGLLVALLLGGTWIIKRMSSSRAVQMNVSSNIKILEQRNLSPKSMIYILNIFGKTIVVAESINGVTHLTEIEGGRIKDEG